MSQDTPMQLKTKAVARQVQDDTPTVIIEAIASQLVIIDKARARVEDEGIVVRDMRGSVIPHPGIKIEADAVALMVSVLSKYKSSEIKKKGNVWGVRSD